MASKKFLLYILFMLAGCNHLINQRNVLTNHHILNIDPQGGAARNDNFIHDPKAILLEYFLGFANELNNYWQIFISTTVPRGINLADMAILSLDGLCKVFPYVVNPSLDKINLPAVRDIHDVANRIGLTLTPEFNTICVELSNANNWTPQAVTQLAKAYAICAFYSAHSAHAIYCWSAVTHIVTDKARKAAAISASKALTAAAIAVIATHLTATFIDEDRGDVANTLINAQAVYHVTKLAVDAGIQLMPATIDTIIFAAYSAADRIARTVSGSGSGSLDRRCITDIRNIIECFRETFRNRNILDELAATLRSIPSYALDRPLAQIAIDAHKARAASSS